jgi:predicted TIM-barrel fold metal-dependent hydrolase
VEYRVIDADSHLNSPPDLYTSRVPAKYKDRAPRIVHEDGHDAWVVDGGTPRPLTILAAAAGKTPTDLAKRFIKFEEMMPGAHDPKARLRDLDLDGIDAQVLFGDGAMAAQDVELRTVLVRAYNDWLSEFCSVAPERFLGQAVVPVHDPQEAVKEIERTGKMRGLRGLFVGDDGADYPITDASYDRLWAAAAEQRRPVNIHIGGGALRRRNLLFGQNPPPGQKEAFVSIAPMSIAETLAMLIFGGTFERHPALQVVIAEGGIGWVAYFIERMDSVFHKQGRWAGTTIKEKPSVYFRRNVLVTFEEDEAGIRTYDLIGAKRIMWSSDYPHSDTTWPRSRETIEQHFGKLPADDRRAMVLENAGKLYGLL